MMLWGSVRDAVELTVVCSSLFGARIACGFLFVVKI